MSAPTFAGIDFGFGNNESDDVRAFYRTSREGIEVARNEWSIPGVDAVWMQRLGKRGRPIVWVVTLLFKSLSARKTWEEEIEAKLNDKTYTMVLHGRTYKHVQLINFRDVEPPSGCSAPWAGRSVYVLEFKQLVVT